MHHQLVKMQTSGQSVLPCAAKAHQHNGHSFTPCGRSGLMLIVIVHLTATFMGMGSS